MNSERFLVELPASGTPGLEAFDPRLSDIMAAVQNGNMETAVQLSLELFDSGEYDIRAVLYVVYHDLSLNGAASLPVMFEALAAIFGMNWPAFGPEKNKEKHAHSAVAWFFKTLSRQLGRLEADGGEKFFDFAHGLELADAQRLNDAVYAFNENFDAILGPLAEKTRNSRREVTLMCSKFADILQAELDAAASEAEAETEADDSSSSDDSNTGMASDAQTSVAGSVELQRLLKKMTAFGDLTKSGRFELAAVVLADIQDTLANFDPVKFFPSVFSEYARHLALNVDNVWGHLDMRGSPQWDALEAYYKADIEGFMKLEN